MKELIWICICCASVTAFGIDKISGAAKTDSCAVRLSNQPMKTGEPESGTQFCSGSMIENGSIVVFAAHCLNQILEKKSDGLKDNSFEIAHPDQETSRRFKLSAGQYSIFTGEQLSTVSDRSDFLDSGNPKYIKDDLAMLKLSSAISDKLNCPVLPNLTDCNEFETSVLSFGNTLGLFVDFFISNEMVQTGTSIRKVTSWYPSQRVIQVKSTDLEFSPASPEVKNLQAPLKVSFALAGKEVRMRKGDSGSVAYWKHNSKDIFVGVQSATISGSPNKAYFSQICKHVGTKKFEEFMMSVKSDKLVQ